MSHPTHKIKLSESSAYTRVCVLCGATDALNNTKLLYPCEAFPKSAYKVLKNLREALIPFDAAVFNDNGDVTYSHPTNQQYLNLVSSLKEFDKIWKSVLERTI